MSDRFSRPIYLALAEGRDLTAEQESHLQGCDACRTAADRAREFERALHRDLAELATPLPADPLSVADARPARLARPAVAFAVVALLLTAGAAGALLTTPEPSPEPPTTTDPVPSPSVPASAIPDVGQLEAGDYAQMAVDELELLGAPDGDAFTSMQPGSEAWVVRVRDGWYLVEAVDASSNEYVFGWVPAAGAGEDPQSRAPTLRETSPAECQALDQFGTLVLAAMHPQRQLECYAGDELTLEGYAIEYEDRGAEKAYTGQPEWLADVPPLYLSGAIGPAVNSGSVPLHLSPYVSLNIPTSEREAHDGFLLRVTGHVGDRDSVDCTRIPLIEAYPPIDDELSETWCRQRFGVDRVDLVEPDTPEPTAAPQEYTESTSAEEDVIAVTLELPAADAPAS